MALDQPPDMGPNEQLIDTFCNQFVPPLTYVKTDKINNSPVPDAWTTSVWLNSKGVGFTCVVYQNQLHIHLENHGATTDLATLAGQQMAAAMAQVAALP